MSKAAIVPATEPTTPPPAKSRTKSKPTVPGLPRLNPFEFYIVGHDNVPGLTADHPLYKQLLDERVNLPLTEGMLDMFRTLRGEIPPLEVVMWAFEGKSYPLILDGRQRTRYGREEWTCQEQAGAPEAQRIVLPYFVTAVEDTKLFAASRSRNVSVKSDPMMVARDMKRLTDPKPEGEGMSTVECGKVYGLTDERVRQYLALLRLDASAQTLISDLKLASSAASYLATLEPNLALDVLMQLKEGMGKGIKPTREEAQKHGKAAAGKAGNTPKDKIESARKAMERLATLDTKSVLLRTESATKEQLLSTISSLLATIDGVNRALFTKDMDFPEPIKSQPLGYTLAVVANTGD